MALLPIVCACSKPAPPAPVDPPLAPSVSASAPPVVASTAAPLASASVAAAPSAPTKRAEGKRLTKEQAKVLRQAIAEGRKLGHAGKWNEAVAVFSKVPDETRDGVLLSELCYAAYKDGSYPVAEDSCARARELVHAPVLRAQVLFNSGLSSEASGDWQAATRFYEESLALRANDTVKKRLAEAQKKASAKAPKESCDRSFPSLDEACACLVHRRTDYFLPIALFGNAKGVCAPQAKPTSATARSLRLAPTEGDEGNDMKFLFLAEGTRWTKMPVEIGDYEPGAFGVHNTGGFDRFEEKIVKGNTWLLVHATQANNDYNLGGLELYASIRTQVTPCRLTPKPRCGIAVPLKNEDSLSYEDRGEDMSAEERKEFEAMKKNAYTRTYETDLVLGDDGESFTVTLKSGDRTQVAPGILGKHTL